MEITRERLQRHLANRERKLRSHEELRLKADAERESGQAEKVRPLYEETIRRSGIYSSARLEQATARIITNWVDEGKIDDEAGDWFLKYCDLGYAGDARIEAVAGRTLARMTEGEEKTHVLKHALLATEKHENWQDTIEITNRTLTEDPIAWPIIISVDRANILWDLGEKKQAISALGGAFDSAKAILRREKEREVRLAAASDGGVARVQQARKLAESRNPFDKARGFIYFLQGRQLVHWSCFGDKKTQGNHNYERSRVIEMWFGEIVAHFPWLSLIPPVRSSFIRTWQKLIREHRGPSYKTVMRFYDTPLNKVVKEIIRH